MSKSSLLYLCHRIPYPPNKGDKIRSFHLLEYLSQHYDVHLGAFVDDPEDWRYAKDLQAYCASVQLIGLRPSMAKLKGLRAFVSGEPISLPYYRSGQLQQWVDNTMAANNISRVVLFSSPMAQFVWGKAYAQLTRVMDLVDVDSDKWRQYAEKKSSLAAWVYRREWRTLAAIEHRIAEDFHACLLVSAQEAELFKQQLPANLQEKVYALRNGVNTDYFDPDSAEIADLNEPVDVVFTGAMDYWANVDAVCWFAEHVWPQVLALHPQARFTIVGGNPTAQVRALAARKGIDVTGRVADVRPYLKAAKVVVAPLQIARGIQNKVLEAMAMAKPVVATAMAMEGINAPKAGNASTDNAQAFASATVAALNNAQIVAENRRFVLEHFNWRASLQALQPLLEAQ